MGYYLAIKIKGLLIHPTHTWMNLKHISLSERIQLQKVPYHMIPFVLEKANMEEQKTDQWLPGVGVGWGLNIKGPHEGIPWNNGIILYSVCAGCYENLFTLKTHRSVRWKKRIFLQVNFEKIAYNNKFYQDEIKWEWVIDFKRDKAGEIEMSTVKQDHV